MQPCNRRYLTSVHDRPQICGSQNFTVAIHEQRARCTMLLRWVLVEVIIFFFALAFEGLILLKVRLLQGCNDNNKSCRKKNVTYKYICKL